MEDVPFFLSQFHSLHLFYQFQADCVYKNLLKMLVLLVTVCFISFLFIFIVSVVSVEDVQFFLSPFHSLHLFQQFQADCVYKKSLEDACYFLLQSVPLISIHFHCFSCFSGRCPIFLSPFHSLHLFQQFQANCVYKKSLEDACYVLLQSVSLVFYSFSMFQLFQWKMSNFFRR